MCRKPIGIKPDDVHSHVNRKLQRKVTAVFAEETFGREVEDAKLDVEYEVCIFVTFA